MGWLACSLLLQSACLCNRHAPPPLPPSCLLPCSYHRATHPFALSHGHGQTNDFGVAKDGSRKDSFSPGMALTARATLFAEGCRGSLSQHIMKRFQLREQVGAQPQTYALGLKEVWEVGAQAGGVQPVHYHGVRLATLRLLEHQRDLHL